MTRVPAWLPVDRLVRTCEAVTGWGRRRREALLFAAAVLAGGLVGAAVRGAWLTR